MDDQVEYGFSTAIFVLEHVAEKTTAAEAERVFGEVAKENFWRMWPPIRDWAAELWQLIEDERGSSSRPVEDDDLDDVGGGG